MEGAQAARIRLTVRRGSDWADFGAELPKDLRGHLKGGPIGAIDDHLDPIQQSGTRD